MMVVEYLHSWMNDYRLKNLVAHVHYSVVVVDGVENYDAVIVATLSSYLVYHSIDDDESIIVAGLLRFMMAIFVAIDC